GVRENPAHRLRQGKEVVRSGEGERLVNGEPRRCRASRPGHLRPELHPHAPDQLVGPFEVRHLSPHSTVLAYRSYDRTVKLQWESLSRLCKTLQSKGPPPLPQACLRYVLGCGRRRLAHLGAIELDYNLAHHLPGLDRCRHPVGHVDLDLHLFFFPLLDQHAHVSSRDQGDTLDHPAFDRRVPPHSSTLLNRHQHAVIGKALVQELRRALKTIPLQGRTQHDDDQAEVPSLGTAGDTETGLVVKPSLDAIGPGRLAQQPVRVIQGELAVAKRLLDGPSPLGHFRELHQLASENRQVVGAHLIVLLTWPCRQAVHAVVMGLFEAEFRGLIVHQVNEGIGTTGHVLGQGCSRIISRVNHHRLQEVFDGKGFPLFKVNLRATHLGSPARRGYHVAELEAAIPHPLHDEQRGHHLDHRGRRPRDMDVFFEQHLAGPRLHEDRRLIRGRLLGTGAFFTQYPLFGVLGLRYRAPPGVHHSREGKHGQQYQPPP